MRILFRPDDHIPFHSFWKFARSTSFALELNLFSFDALSVSSYLQHMNDASVNNDIQNAAHNFSFIVSGFVDLLCVHYHWKDSFSIHEKCTATIITTSFT